MNKWNTIALYAAIICAVSAVYLFGNITQLAKSSIHFLLPSYSEAGLYNLGNTYENNDDYKLYKCPVRDEEGSKVLCSLKGKSEEEITALREQDKEKYRANQLKHAHGKDYQNIIDSLLTILIGAIFFIIHWRILKRALKTPV